MQTLIAISRAIQSLTPAQVILGSVALWLVSFFVAKRFVSKIK